jgi:hypothetical protein
MNHSLATPPPGSALRRYLVRTWEEPDSRSTLIGLVGVVLFHLLLLVTAPRLFTLDASVLPRAHDSAKQFNIELAPELFADQAREEPLNFVETNPDAPENTPDRTTNFGAHNQQVAQPEATPDGRSDRPATEGKPDIESNQIVSGQLLTPEERLEAFAAIEMPPAEPTQVAPRAEQNPLPGFEKIEGENRDGFGSNVARFPENPRPIPERIEGARDVPVVEAATGFQPVVDPQRPRPRPQITRQQQVRPAILAENRFGTSNIGNIAVDARWSNYGAYLQRMIDTVQIQWERLLIDGRVYPPSGSTVTVKFVLDDEGRIAHIIDVDNRATEQAARACVSGINDRAPYGPWSDDMKAVLGDRQEMTFTFYYQ